MSFNKICITPHICNDFDPFCAPSRPPKSHNCTGRRNCETQIPHPTPQKHHSPNANPNGTVQKTADLAAPAQSNHSPHFNILHFHTIPRYSHESDKSRFHPKPSPKASPNGSALALYRERLRTVANAETTRREQDPTPRPPPYRSG